MKTVGVLLAAGSGTRTRSKTPKQLFRIGKKYLFQHSLETMLACKTFDVVLVVVSEKTKKVIETTIKTHYPRKNILIVQGGDTRHASIRNSLECIVQKYRTCERVLFQDAARPLVSPKLFSAVLGDAEKYGASIASETVRGLTVVTQKRFVTGVKNGLSVTHMPECYTFRILYKLYAKTPRNSEKTNLELMLASKKKVHCTFSDELNLKVTFPGDVALVAKLLSVQ
ncbi:2-C-methyl-D-erythritol 4-phosphate cytidylyltransferase [Patescibacteria group bacterium]|nr:2-C-methyl-D-erythritol 4-phosphate cytidylyltransferase [Patescibacteria group bacterium]